MPAQDESQHADHPSWGPTPGGELQRFPLFSLSPNPAPEERSRGWGGGKGGLHSQPLPQLRELEHHLEVTHLMSHKGRLASLLILL